jgi:hypothetical protein
VPAPLTGWLALYSSIISPSCRDTLRKQGHPPPLLPPYHSSVAEVLLKIFLLKTISGEKQSS